MSKVLAGLVLILMSQVCNAQNSNSYLSISTGPNGMYFFDGRDLGFSLFNIPKDKFEINDHYVSYPIKPIHFTTSFEISYFNRKLGYGISFNYDLFERGYYDYALSLAEYDPSIRDYLYPTNMILKDYYRFFSLEAIKRILDVKGFVTNLKGGVTYKRGGVSYTGPNPISYHLIYDGHFSQDFGFNVGMETLYETPINISRAEHFIFLLFSC